MGENNAAYTRTRISKLLHLKSERDVNAPLQSVLGSQNEIQWDEGEGRGGGVYDRRGVSRH